MKACFQTLAFVCLAAISANAQGTLTVINGARFETQFPVSPGSYAQAYGTFTGAPTQTAPGIPLPTELGGVQVLIGTANTPAPLYAVGSTVVSFVVPSSVPAGRQSVRVVRAGADLATGTMDVFPVSPGIFYVLNDPLKQGGILNQDSIYAIQATPARRGQVIQIFATGQGAVSASVPDGGVPGGLVTATGVTKAYVSVDEAEIVFSGLSPQFPGLWQINVRVPDKPYITGQVPVFVSIDGVSSNVVSFWIAQ
jgi:uncharacterized protein (TIGR03437 family)